MRFFLPLSLLMYITSTCFAQDGTIDFSFNTRDSGYYNGDGASGAVYTSVVLPDGKIIIGGFFQNYNGSKQSNLIRLHPDGRLDTSFNAGGTGIPGSWVSVVKYLPDGRLLVAGDFLTYNNVPRHLILRLHPDGSLDTTFHAGNNFTANSSISSLAVQTDGKILIAGDFTRVSGVLCPGFARLLPDGALDTSFHPTDTTATIHAIALQSSGKILVGGLLGRFNSAPVKFLWRLDPDGRTDTSFRLGTGPDSTIYTITVLNDDRILIGGDFSKVDGAARSRVARLQADGSLDTSFIPDLQLINPPLAFAEDDKGKVVVGGFFDGLYRLNTNGSRDLSFNPNAAVGGYVTVGPSGSRFNVVHSLTRQADGKYIVGGDFVQFRDTICNHVLRITDQGYRDTTFNRGQGANDGVYALRVLGDGKILIAGSFTAYNDKMVQGITRLLPDGTVDSTFNKNGTGFKDQLAIERIYAMEVQPDGRILIGGDFSKYNGAKAYSIARLQGNGYLDESFIPGSGPAGYIFTLAVQPDEKIMVGGAFKSFNGVYVRSLVRLNSDGSIDQSFTSKFDIAEDIVEIHQVSIQPDGKYIVCGDFKTYAGLSRRNIIRLLPNGDLDPSFNTGGNGTDGFVGGAVLQPDGKILVSGAFSFYNGISKTRLLRLEPDGSLDSSFSFIMNPSPNVSAGRPCLLPDGKIVLDIYNSFFSDTGFIVRLLPNGTIDTSFSGEAWKAEYAAANNLSPYVNLPGANLVLQGDGKLLVHGVLGAYNGIGRNRVARINNTTAPSLSIESMATLRVCAGGTLNIPFRSIALGPEAVINAELSDASGSFSDPKVIGSITGLSYGQLVGTIPSNTTAGTGYRIRLVSSQPGITSSDNGANITINAFAASPTWIGAFSSEWNDVRNWCGSIPSATTDVTILAGTPYNAIVSSNAQARNITISAGATLTMDASSFLNLYGNITNSGTLATTNGTIQFKGATIQTIPSMTISKMILSGSGGVALNGNLSVTQFLDFTQGQLTLGAYNLSITEASFGSLNSHIVTNGTGTVSFGDPSTRTLMVFPVGADASSYNPVTIVGTGGKNFSVRVSNSLPTTILNPARAVNRTWQIVPSASLSFPASVEIRFADSEGNTSFSSGLPLEAGVLSGNTWTLVPPSGLSLSGNASVRTVTLSTSNFGEVVIGNQGTIQTPLAVSSIDAEGTYAELRPTLVTSNHVQLKVNARRAMQINWTITTTTGITVYKFTQQVHSGENLMSLSLPSLSSGVYQLVGTSTSGSTWAVRFVRL